MDRSEIHFNSPGTIRQSLLIGELALLTIFINLFYLILDYLNDFQETLYIYMIVIVIAGIVYLLNRLGYFTPSKIILLVTVLLNIFIMGTSNMQDTQTHILYFPLIIISFTLFEYKHLWKSFVMVTLAIILFVIDYGSDFSFLPRGYMNPDEVYTFTVSNYVIGILSTIYIGYYWVRTNFLSENKLIQRQNELNELTLELQKSQHRYELAITGSNAGLWDWDIENNTIYHGKKWKEMLGYNPDEIVDIDIDRFYSMVHPEDREKVKKAVRQHLARNSAFRTEYRLRKKDGSYKWVLDSGKAVLNGEQKPVRMVGSIIDISERKKAEEKIKKQKDLLEKANDELDRFVYITSHDLKAPLLSIQGLIHLAEISDDDAEVKHCLNLMKDRVKGMENFISDIINYSRNVRSGIIKEEVNLKKLIKSIVNEFLFMKDVDKLKFIISVDENQTLLSDEKRLNVILKNLIFNAIKYHNYEQESPEIEIEARKVKNHMTINVRDNGEGIREEQLTKIFDMFYRASEKSTGSGLGLYIVKEMTGKLNGQIQVTSEYGKGSVFTVTLPDMY
ncbi:MAG: PAS domain-containing protein [Cyclobacteriaceae bacterium]|nr:PAS domain-containing protein [Cyclobacteriaceae bacterium]